jgi:hypothetical protein
VLRVTHFFVCLFPFITRAFLFTIWEEVCRVGDLQVDPTIRFALKKNVFDLPANNKQERTVNTRLAPGEADEGDE